MAYPKDLLDKYQLLGDPEAALHRNICNLISAYNSPWDPLTELIQNAVDAINLRSKHETSGWKGRIRIEIDSSNNSIVVEDNGLGMPQGREEDMILPGGSLKTNNNTYGHKGLGFTYCCHISDDISVESNSLHGDKSRWSFKGAFSWITASSSSPSLIKNTSNEIRGGSLKDEPGTTIKMLFAIGRYETTIANTAVFEKFFHWADDEKLLSFVLRTRTAIGQVSSLFGSTPKPEVEVEVLLVNSDSVFSVPYRFFDIENYAPLSNENFQSATDYNLNVLQNVHKANKTHFGVYHTFDSDKTSNCPVLKVGRVNGGIKFKAFVYACGKRNLEKALGDYDKRLTDDDEFRYLALTTDVHLSIAGMPCGVPINSWDNYGSFEQRYFAMIDTDLSFGKVLDPGRKTISSYYVDLLVNKTRALTRSDNTYFSGTSFADIASHLHNTAGVSQSGSRGPANYIKKWASRPHILAKSLCIDKEPEDELAVYLLFGELIGRGIIPGYRFLYASGVAIYDAALTFSLDLTDSEKLNSTANGTCLYGVGSRLINSIGAIKDYKWEDPTSGQRHLVTEFKRNVDDLLDDLDSRKSDKDISEIDLLICWGWDNTSISNKQASLSLVNENSRMFSGVTHELSRAGYDINVICLKEIVEKLVSRNDLA